MSHQCYVTAKEDSYPRQVALPVCFARGKATAGALCVVLGTAMQKRLRKTRQPPKENSGYD